MINLFYLAEGLLL